MATSTSISAFARPGLPGRSGPVWGCWHGVAAFLMVLAGFIQIARGEDLRGYAPSSPFPAMPQRWQVLDGWVRNDSDRPLDVFLVNTIEGNPGVQFVTPVWVPAHAVRQVPQIVRTGPMAEAGRYLKTHNSLVSQRTPERLFSRDEGLLRVAPGPVSLLKLTDAEGMGTMAETLWRSTGLQGGLSAPQPAQIPSLLLGLSGITHMVLGASAPELDAAQLAAVRDWLAAGGRLLVAETQVDPAFMALLLGDDWTVRRVDTVEQSQIADGGRTFWLESPARFDRVLASGFETLASIDGWPSLLRRQVGRGELFVMSLEPRAWVNPEGRGTASLDALAEAFLKPARELVSNTAPLHRAAEMRIGYRIAPRRVVAMFMALFVGVMAVSGVILYRRGYAAAASLLAAGLAVITGGGLLLVGARTRGAAPAAVSSVAMVSLVAGQAHVEGVTDLYMPRAAGDTLRMARDTMLWPERPLSAGASARLVWTDTQRAEWRQLPVPSGAVLRTNVAAKLRVPEAPRLTARFTDRGLVATIRPGAFPALADWVLRTPGGMVRPVPLADGNLALGDEPFAGFQGLQAQTGTDRQRARQATFEQLFARSPGRGTAAYAWADVGAWFDPLPQMNVAHHGDAIVALPLDLEPASPGDRVLVPAALIPMEVSRTAGGKRSAAPYDPVRGEWVQAVSSGGAFVLRFVLPREVRPLTPTALTLRLHVRMPGRTLEVLAPASEGPKHTAGTVAATLNSPQDAIQVALPPKTFVPDDQGGIRVALRVSDLDGSDRTRTWEIHHAELSVLGQVNAAPGH